MAAQIVDLWIYKQLGDDERSFFRKKKTKYYMANPVLSQSPVARIENTYIVEIIHLTKNPISILIFCFSQFVNIFSAHPGLHLVYIVMIIFNFTEMLSKVSSLRRRKQFRPEI